MSLSACAGDYPLAPTPCDDYCHATKDFQCSYYSPSSCVVRCEQQGFNAPECRAELNQVVSCVSATPNATRCTHIGDPASDPCGAELASLRNCSVLQRIARGQP